MELTIANSYITVNSSSVKRKLLT